MVDDMVDHTRLLSMMFSYFFEEVFYLFLDHS